MNRIALSRWRAAAGVAGICVLIVIGTAGRDMRIQLVTVVGDTSNQTVTVDSKTQLDTRVASAMAMLITTLSMFVQLLEAKKVLTPAQATICRQIEQALTTPVIWALIGALAGVRDTWTIVLLAMLGVLIAVFDAMEENLLDCLHWIPFCASMLATTAAGVAVLWHLSNSDAERYVRGLTFFHIGVSIFSAMVPECSLAMSWPKDHTERIYIISSLLGKHLLLFCATIGIRIHVDSL